MTATSLSNDLLWPRAAEWITPVSIGTMPVSDLAILGVPAHSSSITPTNAHLTPQAIRAALLHYSTFAASRGVDVSSVKAVDLGDVEDPDGPDGEARVVEAVKNASGRCALLLALGGDNSITFSVVRGLFAGYLGECGLVTVDAHHDLRDGKSNGSPVRRLIEAGLPGRNVVQIGIADFSNSAAYAARATEHGITVIPRSELRQRDVAEVVDRALGIAGRNGRPVYVDLDVDACDRSVAPGCPSAAPGGLSADELRQMAFLFGRDPRVKGVDITEIDATADASDQRTVRLAALVVLETAAGLCVRLAR